MKSDSKPDRHEQGQHQKPGNRPHSDRVVQPSDYEFPNYRILQFSRSPASARVKTRLATVLPGDRRLDLHCAMTQWICEKSTAAKLSPVQLWVEGDLDHPFLTGLENALAVQLFSQRGADLGERLADAASQGIAAAAGVIMIGSDCPFIDADYLRRALEQLQRSDAVVGPATDGGYVLLGLRKANPHVFANISWGSERVRAETEARLRELDWTCSRLGTLADIDRPEDLRLLGDERLPLSLRRFAPISGARGPSGI